MNRPFRFGVQIGKAASAREWADIAREAEALGYSSLHMPDHFNDQWAPGPALAAAAAVTERLHIGAMMYCNDFRHPVVLAKEAATLDVLSEGRLELGLGAGWMRTDYDAAGLPYDAPAVRIDRMVEALDAMVGLWGDAPCTFEGKHYQIRNLNGLPKPVRRPHPRLVIGGGGKRMLSIAARYADVVGINPNLKAGEIGPDAIADLTAEATTRKVDWVREAAGQRYASIELSAIMFSFLMMDDARQALEQIAAGFGVPPQSLEDAPYVAAGSAEHIAEKLQQRRDKWDISYVLVGGLDAMRQFAPVVQRLAGK